MAFPPLLEDLGIRAGDLLRRADLPADLFARRSATLSAEEYFRCWEAMMEESGDPLLPVKIGQVIRTESLYPPVFAALCSPNFRTAVERVGKYKRLIGPMRLEGRDERQGFRMELSWIDEKPAPPPTLVVAELAFFVSLARTATREQISPLAVQLRSLPEGSERFGEFFACALTTGRSNRILFRHADVELPFLTLNEAMWSAFEPGLKQRLAELEADASMSDRVRAFLNEALPSGRVSVEIVSRELGMSRRTLQRRLTSEGTSYQRLLQETRSALADHYLRQTTLPAAEISFLLGFEEPNSFYRAFREWTGRTPEGMRMVG